MDKCESCQFYDFDEAWGDNVCTVEMDEDEVAALELRGVRDCPYWRPGDDYATARKQ